ncbi:MAG TPA: PaaX family transcriptional regulator C-terminal domain-containing protein [Trebonia sp.]|jgi:phenylacetic acid degradation operon negative regulatory protein
MTHGISPPTVSRRREIGQASGRSLLMTILGEFVLPRGRPVWTQALVSALSLFGIEQKSARQALARTAAEGWLASERVGRKVRWSLTPPGQRLLSDGAQRIYSFGRDEVDWDGRWLLLLLVSVPESQRDLRHRVRSRLNWAGFGSPAPGVWISPHPGRQAEGQRILADAGLDHSALSFVAGYGQIGSQEALVARSWDLGGIEQLYEDFIEEFTGLDPVTGEAALMAQTRLVHEWRRFPFLDPRLPSRLLPQNWSGAKAADLFHTRHADWHPAAQRHWERLTSDAD